VKLLLEALEQKNAEGKSDKLDEEISKRIQQIKVVLYGDQDKEVNPARCGEIAAWIKREDLMMRLVVDLPTLQFEARKNVAQIFNNLLRRDVEDFSGYVCARKDLLDMLVQGYERPDIALNCGSILRECIRHEKIARVLLYSENLWLFFENYVHMEAFDVASDAFVTFKELLTKHKELSAIFLQENFDQVFEKYNNMLLESLNYVTKRQSLKLLSEILLDRANFKVMMQYISNKKNLRIMMNLLRDKSANIQFEAFHVFKVFVANPKKPDDITVILVNNRDKLIAFLQNFHNDKEDEQFTEEKQLLINTLSKLH